MELDPADDSPSTETSQTKVDDVEMDSRTSGVGRKRDLHDATQQSIGEPSQDYDSEDGNEQRSRKRARHLAGEATDSVSDENVLNTFSPLPAAASLEKPGINSPSAKQKVAHALPVSLTGTSEVTKEASPLLRIAGPQSIETRDPAAADASSGSDAPASLTELAMGVSSLVKPSASQLEPRNAGWNRGVQSGLRTSFAARPRLAASKPVDSLQCEPDTKLSIQSPILSIDSDGTESNDNEENSSYDEDDFDEPVNDSAPTTTTSTGKTSASTADKPFKKLSKNMRKMLSGAARSEYNKALEAHRKKIKDKKLEMLRENTIRAEKLLAQEKQWPVSQDEIVTAITQGLTFYAKDVSRGFSYKSKSGVFDLPQIMDKNGLPIKSDRFTFNLFAPAFIRQNGLKAKSLDITDIRGAFNTYNNKGYYRHLLGIKPGCDKIAATARSSNAMTIEQAMKLAAEPQNLPIMHAGHAASRTLDSEPSAAASANLATEPLVKLSKPQKSKLPVEEVVTHETEKRKAILQEATIVAERYINEAGGWPLPARFKKISEEITQGKTFYARSGLPAIIYQKRKETFEIPEMFDEQGIPIKVQEHSFNSFSLHFLQHNRAKISKINSRDWLKKAFSQYHSTFYSHVPNFILPVHTADAPGAYTLEQAKQMVITELHKPKVQDLQGPMTSSRSKEQSPPEAGTEISHENMGGAQSFVDKVQSHLNRHENGSAGMASNADRVATLMQLGQQAQKSQQQGPMEEVIASDSKGQGFVQSKEPEQAGEPNIIVQPQSNVEDTVMKDTSLPPEVIDKGPTLEIGHPMYLLLQRKYFPSVDTFQVRCIACASVGHVSSNCPALQCTVCGINGDHSDFTCPQNARCRKCRQRGHTTSQCPEKLMASKSEIESTPCNVCGVPGHLETACHFIWRSYTPTSEPRQVQAIPVECYTCGASGHYGTECGILNRPCHSGKVTWSTSNVQRYVDPMSRERAVSAGVDYSIPTKAAKQFSIKGMGGATNPYTMDDSEEEGEFIRPKINTGPAAPTQIRFGNSSKVNSTRPSDFPDRSNGTRRGPNTRADSAYDNYALPQQMPVGRHNSYRLAVVIPYNPNLNDQYSDPSTSGSNGRNTQDQRPTGAVERKTRTRQSKRRAVNFN